MEGREKLEGEGRERGRGKGEKGREGKGKGGRGKGREGGAFRQIKIYNYTPVGTPTLRLELQPGLNVIRDQDKKTRKV